MRERYEEIDIMRGIAIIAMIILHVAAYYKHDATIFALWDTLEFAVPIFVFCSGYLFYKQESHKHIAHTLGYFKKRLVRLLVPYYIFLICYLPIVYFAQPKNVTQEALVANIFLTGGVDFNWMVLLFLLLSFLMPGLMYLFNKKRIVFNAYTLIAAAASVLFLFIYPHEHSRLLMILPWSLLIVFSWVVAKYEHSVRNMAVLYGASIFIFLVSRAAIVMQNNPIDHFSNKYPPNIYHLSYGFLSIIGLFYLSKFFRKSHGSVRRIISFFSKYSYTIYFIHIFLIYFITVVMKEGSETMPFIVFFLEVFLLTAGIQILFNAAHRFSTLKRGPTI